MILLKIGCQVIYKTFTLKKDESANTLTSLQIAASCMRGLDLIALIVYGWGNKKLKSLDKFTYVPSVSIKKVMTRGQMFELAQKLIKDNIVSDIDEAMEIVKKEREKEREIEKSEPPLKTLVHGLKKSSKLVTSFWWSFLSGTATSNIGVHLNELHPLFVPKYFVLKLDSDTGSKGTYTYIFTTPQLKDLEWVKSCEKSKCIIPPMKGRYYGVDSEDKIVSSSPRERVLHSSKIIPVYKGVPLPAWVENLSTVLRTSPEHLRKKDVNLLKKILMDESYYSTMTSVMNTLADSEPTVSTLKEYFGLVGKDVKTSRTALEDLLKNCKEIPKTFENPTTMMFDNSASDNIDFKANNVIDFTRH
jgi:hypothetical protein